MNISRTDSRRLLVFGIAMLLTIIVISFAIYGSLAYFKGPEIIIDFPSNNYSTTSKTIEIKGKAYRINKILLNEKPIFIDEYGNWKETLVIFEGINKITILISDKFGRNKKTILDVVGL